MMNVLRRCVLSIVLMIPIAVEAQDQAEQARRAAVEKQIKTFGLTEEKLTKLKESGVDVRSSLFSGKHLDERVRSALSDCVVIGRVDSIIMTPAPATDPFHSRVRIIVADVLKGKVKDLKVVEVLLQSGLLSGNNYIKVFPDPRFKLGEEVLLFMRYPEKDSYFTTRYRDYFQHHGSYLHRNIFVVDETSKSTIKEKKVLYNDVEKMIDSLVVGVKEVDSLLNK